MIKYIIFLLFPVACFGQITSYTATQTGVGNAEVYWPAGATHAVVFIPGRDERTTKEQMYVHGSPIKRVRDGWRPDFAVIAIQPGGYNSSSYLRVATMMNWIYKTFPIKTYLATGLSYGAADWYDYIKKCNATDYKPPYSAVLMSITSESQCTDKTKLCGTDVRWKDIKSWGMCGKGDSHYGKQMGYHTAMFKANYDTRWTGFDGEAHCCWEKRYDPAWKDVSYGVGVYDLRPATTPTEPALTINAGRDTTIYFPQDSIILRPETNAPVGAEIRSTVIEGFGLVDGMIIRNLYKGRVTVRVYVFYNGKQAYDDITITAVYEPDAVFRRFKLGDLNMVILNDGRIMQEF